jgi:hypothetical protein
MLARYSKYNLLWVDGRGGKMMCSISDGCGSDGLSNGVAAK